MIVYQRVVPRRVTHPFIPLNPGCLMMGSLFHGLFHNPHTTGYSRNDIKNPDFNAALFRVLKVDGSWSLFFEGWIFLRLPKGGKQTVGDVCFLVTFAHKNSVRGEENLLNLRWKTLWLLMGWVWLMLLMFFFSFFGSTGSSSKWCFRFFCFFCFWAVKKNLDTSTF